MIVWSVFEASEVRIISCGESEGGVKVLADFPEATEMASGSGSGIQRALLFGRGLSSMGTRGRFKARIAQSTGKGLLKQS